MTTKRSHGDGGIDTRGENVHRLRYRLNGKRFTKTFHGTSTDARKELRRLIRSGDVGEHIAPDKVKFGEWVDRWFVLLNRQQVEGDARRRGLVSNRTIEKYEQLLYGHVVPVLGARPIQLIQASEIDDLYMALAKKLAPRTVAHLHSVLGACFKAAARKGLISSSPTARAEVPQPGESDHGMVLDRDQLRTLLEGFRGLALFPIVVTLALTGARRTAQRGAGTAMARFRRLEQNPEDRARRRANQKTRSCNQGSKNETRQADDRNRRRPDRPALLRTRKAFANFRRRAGWRDRRPLIDEAARRRPNVSWAARAG
jgi:hypothetical protein